MPRACYDVLDALNDQAVGNGDDPVQHGRQGPQGGGVLKLEKLALFEDKPVAVSSLDVVALLGSQLKTELAINYFGVNPYRVSL